MICINALSDRRVSRVSAVPVKRIFLNRMGKGMIQHAAVAAISVE